VILGGPSLRTTDLSPLDGRGTITMGVNNSWLMRRPNLWIGVDTPGRFSNLGWEDPSILKFLPLCHTRSAIRRWEGDKLVSAGKVAAEMPGTLFFRRNDDFDPKTYWTDTTLHWGTLKGKEDALGIPNSRSVMIGIFRLAHWLGFKRVNLVGADFRMPTDEATSPYAWAEKKDAKGRRANNSLYRSLNRRFDSLVKGGMPIEVFNCTPSSGLLSFPHKPLKEAVAETEWEGDHRTEGWYT